MVLTRGQTKLRSAMLARDKRDGLGRRHGQAATPGGTCDSAVVGACGPVRVGTRGEGVLSWVRLGACGCACREALQWAVVQGVLLEPAFDHLPCFRALARERAREGEWAGFPGRGKEGEVGGCRQAGQASAIRPHGLLARVPFDVLAKWSRCRLTTYTNGAGAV